MAGHAEAQRIAAEFGLGGHVRVWRRGWSRAAGLVLGLGFVIGLPAMTAVLALTTTPLTESAPLPLPDDVALGTVMALPVVLVLGLRDTLHEFEAGLASVSVYRRRVTVVRWADLAAMSEDTHQDEDGHWHFDGYVLHDHAGHTVDIPKRAHPLIARAEQILAARPGWPAD